MMRITDQLPPAHPTLGGSPQPGRGPDRSGTAASWPPGGARPGAARRVVCFPALTAGRPGGGRGCRAARGDAGGYGALCKVRARPPTPVGTGLHADVPVSSVLRRTPGGSCAPELTPDAGGLDQRRRRSPETGSAAESAAGGLGQPPSHGAWPCPRAAFLSLPAPPLSSARSLSAAPRPAGAGQAATRAPALPGHRRAARDSSCYGQTLEGGQGRGKGRVVSPVLCLFL